MNAHLKILTVVLFTIVSLQTANAQNREFRLLEKRDYEKLEKVLQRSLGKDSINPGSKYVYSLLYLDSAFWRFNIDSSYYFINSAIANMAFLDEKELEKLAKDEITDSTLHLHQSKVEAAAYRKARQIHSLDAYNYFLEEFKGATQTDSAIYHRNAIAYQKAADINTYQSFQEFIYTYPNAIQIPEAKSNYERLLFRSMTTDGKLDTYIRFLKNNPDTPHRKEAERNIFEIVTADNGIESYVWFIEKYPKSAFRQTSINFLYHRYKETAGPQEAINKYDFIRQNDSIYMIVQAEKGVVIPVYENKLYAFVNQKGEYLIPYNYDSLNTSYLCGNIEEDYLITWEEGNKKIVSLLGGLIYENNFDNVEDIGSGLLKVSNDGLSGVVHKSGKLLIDLDFDDVALVNNAFLKININGRWGLVSLQGRKLLPVEYDDITSEGEFIILEKDGLFAMSNVQEIKNAAQEEEINLQFTYDDYFLIDDNHLLVIFGDKEALLSEDLKIISPLHEYKIDRYFEGWVVKSPEGYRIFDLIYHPLHDSLFSDIIKHKNRIAFKSGNKWGIYQQNEIFTSEAVYDSVRFLSDHISVLFKNDSVFAAFPGDTLVDINNAENIRLIKSQTSQDGNAQEYLLVEEGRDNKLVFNTNAIKVLEGRYDEIEALGAEYLVVTRNGKKGLFHKSGEELLKLAYQGIANYQNGYVSTLLNGKFGLYNYDKNLLMSAKHEKLLRIYSDQYFISEKNNQLAFVDVENDFITDFEFSRVEYWNDTLALVKGEDLWAVYDIKNESYTYEGIELVRSMPRKPDAKEKFIYITKEGKEGVLSNVRGELIGPTFNDIYNVGTTEDPVFFAEKYIPEAEFYIVIYYEESGEIIRKQVYDGEEYWNIYCDE